jgi:AraC family transcriptional regulator of adaptative response/methylated-DNA-[protein]-cysteine methyltransferase
LRIRLNADFPEAILQDNDPEFTSITSQVLAFLDTPGGKWSLPLDLQGTAFQKRVWAALQTIPTGSTASYADIAKKIGNPKAARAVAQACAANPVAVVVPCHRVVHSNGDLGGYRDGIQRKRALLEQESRNVAGLGPLKGLLC